MADTSPQHIAEALLTAARNAGAEAADALVTDGARIDVEVRRGALEQAERAEGIDLGLRVIMGRRQACVSASDASERTVREMAERAVAMARAAPEDPSVGLAEADQLASDTSAEALALASDAPEPDPAELVERARAAEAAALSVEGISQVDQSGLSVGRRRIHLAATNGFSAGYARTDASIVCIAIAGEGTGMERDHAYESRVAYADLPDPDEIGRLAAERTLARRAPRKPPTGAFPVLYDERVASSLVGHLLQAVNGASVARGASWARGLMGERVLPEGMDIVEDPRRPGILGSRPFDAEGLPTARFPIVENGVLRRWILDLGAARRLGLQSTANAVRSTAGPPSPSVSNIALTQGDRTREDLMREMGTGLLVTSMIGSTISATTGDYSRGASGLWVENGEPAYAVSECTVAGNLRDMLRTLVAANDARTHLSRVVPSLLVEGLTIAGD